MEKPNTFIRAKQLAKLTLQQTRALGMKRIRPRIRICTAYHPAFQVETIHTARSIDSDGLFSQMHTGEEPQESQNLQGRQALSQIITTCYNDVIDDCAESFWQNEPFDGKGKLLSVGIDSRAVIQVVKPRLKGMLATRALSGQLEMMFLLSSCFFLLCVWYEPSGEDILPITARWKLSGDKHSTKYLTRMGASL